MLEYLFSCNLVYSINTIMLIFSLVLKVNNRLYPFYITIMLYYLFKIQIFLHAILKWDRLNFSQEHESSLYLCHLVYLKISACLKIFEWTQQQAYFCCIFCQDWYFLGKLKILLIDILNNWVWRIFFIVKPNLVYSEKFIVSSANSKINVTT